MWDIVIENVAHLSHDLPCFDCGHDGHSYLACSDTCRCPGAPMPGSPWRAGAVPWSAAGVELARAS